jgi:dTDP-4-dehydrorhamnose reductase
MNNSKIKISVIIPSTSKNRNWEDPKDALLYKMINSFKDTTTSDFEYKFFIGYDFDDAFYTKKETILFFKDQGVNIDFTELTCEKGHVTKMWNILAKKAYTEGFDYMYACGDDIIFNKIGWLNISVETLLKNNKIGLTGPMATNGNPNILTQCFVHRTHFEIFKFFYPEEITNWYCDDWINDLYDQKKYLLPEEYSCLNTGETERYDIVKCLDLEKNLVEKHKRIFDIYFYNRNGLTIKNGTNHIVMLCNYKYIHYAVALLLSIHDSYAPNILIHFLCLDEKTKNVISRLQLSTIVVCYEDSILSKEEQLLNFKNNDVRYYFWSLASYFSNYIMTNIVTPTCKSVMYIDTDIIFHKDLSLLYNVFQENQIGIFKHRFDMPDQLKESGKYNVGIVYFKNSVTGRNILNWWTDSVLYKKHSELGLDTCGDQKYLDVFPNMCKKGEIYIDDNIGHGAPWNWASYLNIDSEKYEITYNGSIQPLVFSHFSKFIFDFNKNTYTFENYEIFTNNQKIYESPSLKKIHDDYFEKLKEADVKIQSMHNKIILFGKTGMLGSYIHTYFSKHINLGDLKVIPINFRVTQESLNCLQNILLDHGLDDKTCVINCIGQIPQRKQSDSKDDVYFLVNSIFPQVLWSICQNYGAKMIHPTTDCVFSGKKENGNYLETDKHDEPGSYGMSKSLGEPLGCTVIRTSIIGRENFNKKSFLEWVISTMTNEKKIQGWKNHYWNGITCLEYCKILEKMITSGNFWSGTRHLFSPAPKSKYEMVRMIVDVFKREEEEIIDIEGVESGNIINKTLSSIYDPIFEIQELYEQIKELKYFDLIN